VNPFPVSAEEIAGRYGADFKPSIRWPFPPPTGTRPRLLWGVASTGFPHIGYLPYLAMLCEFARGGWDVLVLISEFHGLLDDEKTAWADLLEKLSLYQSTFAGYFRDTPGVRILRGQDIYLDETYFVGMMRAAKRFPIRSLLASGDTTLRATDPTVGELLYLLTMAFDTQHLEIDLAICGRDESPVYESCRALFEANGMPAPACMYMQMVPGLKAAEMHASSGGGNILRLDATEAEIVAALALFGIRGWPELVTAPNLLAALQSIPGVFSPGLRERWGTGDCAVWVNDASLELARLLEPCRTAPRK